MASGNPKSSQKTVAALYPKDYGNTAPAASTESFYIDTRGFRWAKFVLLAGGVAGTAIDCAVKESSDNFSSDAAAAVTGASFTTIGNTGDNQVQAVIIDCDKTERYLNLAFTFNTITASNLAAVCILSNAEDSVYVGTGGVDAKVTTVAP